MYLLQRVLCDEQLHNSLSILSCFNVCFLFIYVCVWKVICSNWNTKSFITAAILEISRSPSHKQTHTHKGDVLKREVSHLDSLLCLTGLSTESMCQVCLHLCASVCAAQSDVQWICVPACVGLFVCVPANVLNWMMLWNTGCVGFRKSTASIPLSEDIKTIMISVSNSSCGGKWPKDQILNPKRCVSSFIWHLLIKCINLL